MASIEDVSVNGYRASERVGNALKSAAQATGVDFDYLVKTAYRESSFRPNLSADTSSATGLFQSNLAGALTHKNQAYLQQATGLEPTAGELYIAHFLGAKGAADLISAAQSNPTLKASDLFPQAAKANKSLFYGKGGDSNTVQQVYANLIGKHHDSGAPLAAKVSEPLALRPDPENILKSHATAAPQQAGEAKVDGAQAAFLAGHFGSVATAFSAGLDGKSAGFDALLGAKPKDGSSFFLPKSSYAAQEARVANPLGTAPAVPRDNGPSAIPSRYGREGAVAAAPEANVTPSVFNQEKPIVLDGVTPPSLGDGATPRIITSSEFGKTDLPLELGRYLKAYQKSE